VITKLCARSGRVVRVAVARIEGRAHFLTALSCIKFMARMPENRYTRYYNQFYVRLYIPVER
jgi:hypothetical protein